MNKKTKEYTKIGCVFFCFHAPRVALTQPPTALAAVAAGTIRTATAAEKR